MKFRLGKYEVNTNQRFSSESEAVDYVVGLFPDINVEKVKVKVKPFITRKDADKSDNAETENSDSDKQHAKAGSRVVGKEQSGKDK